MKRFGLIIVASLLTLVGSGAAYVLLSLRATELGAGASRVEAARSSLIDEASPITRIVPPTGDELMDPERSLPFFHRFDLAELRRVHELATSCDRSLDGPAASFELEKARRFASFLCGLTAELPKEFFAAPPFMHPAGRSYVEIAATSGHPAFRGEAWLSTHGHLRHVLERKERVGALAGLTRDELAGLWRGEPVVLTKRFALLFASRSSGRGDGGEYLAFPRELWDDRLARESVSPRLLAGLLAVAGGSILGLSGTLLWFAGARLREKRRERENHLFVVRALTHELRTPATSLGLTLEALRDDYDRLPPSSQEAFLLLCEQVQRLHRVISGTTRYLKSDDAKATPAHLRSLPSLKAFFESVLEPYQGRIVTELLADDRPFAIDPYLLKVCVENLVENALRHGMPEVKVRVAVDHGELSVEVEDQGTLPETDPAKLSAAAAYRSGPGLGLGLQVVTKIVKDLGGTLSLARRPATFKLSFRETP